MRTILKNGNIITLNDKKPRAQAVAIENGIITDIGSNGQIESRGADYLVDLKGRTVVPGFIDSHMHMLTAGLTKLQVDLTDACSVSIQDTLNYLHERTKGTQGWIRAFAFSEEHLAEHRVLDRYDIDEVFPDRPVVITRICGHVVIVNSIAMKILNITDDTLNPEGGEFMRDEEGRLNGMAAEKAQQYILDNIPPYTKEQMEQAILSEQAYLMRLGICSVHDAGTDQTGVKEYIDAYRSVADANRLKVRTYLMARPIKGKSFDDFVSYVDGLKKQYTVRNGRLFFGGVKLFADGSLGGRTAAVYDGYTDDADNKGLLLKSDLDKYVTSCHQRGLQVCVHAIGDRAVGYVVDRMAEGVAADGNTNNRHRVEHCELLNCETMNKMKRCGISAMMQPEFVRLFGSTYLKNIGSKRANGSNIINTMLKNDINVGFGTDYPVIDPNPMNGIKTAVMRTVEGTKEVLGLSERISVEEAIRCYTKRCAYASFSEDYQGTIEIGKFGDLAVLDSDPTAISPEQIDSVKVTMTVIGGEVVFEAH